MKVLAPQILVITPENEGYGFPWYMVYVLTIIENQLDLGEIRDK